MRVSDRDVEQSEAGAAEVLRVGELGRRAPDAVGGVDGARWVELLRGGVKRVGDVELHVLVVLRHQPSVVKRHHRVEVKRTIRLETAKDEPQSGCVPVCLHAVPASR
jgi:hypothetical protein